MAQCPELAFTRGGFRKWFWVASARRSLPLIFPSFSGVGWNVLFTGGKTGWLNEKMPGTASRTNPDAKTSSSVWLSDVVGKGGWWRWCWCSVAFLWVAHHVESSVGLTRIMDLDEELFPLKVSEYDSSYLTKWVRLWSPNLLDRPTSERWRDVVRCVRRAAMFIRVECRIDAHGMASGHIMTNIPILSQLQLFKENIPIWR